MRSVVEIGASVPAFLGKLWKLVNDSETNNLISWSPGGKTFVIKNQAEFAKELLPLYYKHNNMASFIRQLNMYGFHKITSVENGGLRYEKDEIEFSHPCFMRGHAYLLEHIKRKIANPKTFGSSDSGEKMLMKPELMNKMLTDVKQMKGKQESLDAKFSAMKQENESLWRELAILRQKHLKQQQIVNNLIQFLMTLVQPARPSNNSGGNVAMKRPSQLMINNAAHNAGNDILGKIKKIKTDKDAYFEELIEDNLEDGPIIHELVHDDLHNDISQDSLNPVHFVTVDTTSNENLSNNHSPIDPSAALQYHVTMEDSDDLDVAEGQRVIYPVSHINKHLTSDDVLPIVTSPTPTLTSSSGSTKQHSLRDQSINVINTTSGSSNTKNQNNRKNIMANKRLLSPSNFNVMNSSADLKLPAEIFASDDSVSDAGITPVEEISVQSLLQDPLETVVTNAKDKMLGGMNIKIENPPEQSKNNKKNKKSNKTIGGLNLAAIKIERQDDIDQWNNMPVEMLNNPEDSRVDLNRRDFNTKNLEDVSSLIGSNKNKNEIDDHLDSMQTDLDSLRELLKSDSYSFDANTLIGLFGSDDPFYGLPYNPTDDRLKESNSAKKVKAEVSDDGSSTCATGLYAENDDAEGNEVISYTGNIPDFEDIRIPELEGENSQDSVCPSPSSSVLNTPQVEIHLSPMYTSRQ